MLDPQLHAYLEARDCLNYFFCFRWVLIHFKREFSFEQVRRWGNSGARLATTSTYAPHTGSWATHTLIMTAHHSDHAHHRLTHLTAFTRV